MKLYRITIDKKEFYVNATSRKNAVEKALAKVDTFYWEIKLDEICKVDSIF